MNGRRRGVPRDQRRPQATIRLALAADAPGIALVLCSSFSEYERAYTRNAFLATTPGRDEILRRLAEGPVWVATVDDEIVGTASGVVVGRTLTLRSVAVEPSRRGCGTGRKLLACAEEFAREHGFEALFLTTTPFLHDAIRLYKRFGFALTGDGPDDLHGTPLLAMTKRL
jgi:GNAT superfamily N-acetyltransferase